MANKIEKQKGVVIGFGIVALVLSLVAIVFGIVLFATMAGKETAALILHIVFGILLILVGLFLVVFGIRIVWIGGSLKATHGSISEVNLGKGDDTNKLKKVCPKCGCTNTVDATECSSCHEPLE